MSRTTDEEMRMGDAMWDGVTRPEALGEEAVSLRHQFADAAKTYNWSCVLAILAEHGELINSIRPGGHSHYAVLHQVAHGGTPIEVAEQLIAMGAWRTLRTANGEQPIDIARHRGHAHLVALLTPAFRRDVPLDTLQAIQTHFHTLIHERADQLVREHALRLPELEPLLEMDVPRLWFPVPGMYGGFHYWLDQLGSDSVLMTESWCRVVGGSGQRHLISPFGSLLIAEGFV